MAQKRSKDEVFLKQIAKRLKELREEKNISQEAFLNDTGILISRIENITNEMTMTTLKRVCDYFGITVIEFFDGIKDQQTSLSPDKLSELKK